MKRCGTGLQPVGSFQGKHRLQTGATLHRLQIGATLDSATRHRLETGATAFTLIELVVVIAIVLVLLGLVLPSASKMWENRKVADAENIIQGLLVTTRARAQRPNATETGLFFYLDRSGAQQIVTIEQVTPEGAALEHPGCDEASNPSHNRESWNDVFRVVDESPFTLPPPMRVVPRYAVEQSPPGVDPMFWFSDAELANSDFRTPYSAFDSPQRHRNFFSIVFNNRGQLLDWRQVLILDFDRDRDNRGDVTGLGIGFNWSTGADGTPNVKEYYDIDPVPPTQTAFGAKPNGGAEAICFLVVDDANSSDPTAINFPSVDGLLVYDDSGFVEAGDPAAKREYLLRYAQPFYVNRLTGAVIRGPVGESF